jgi:hypothetical protein
VAPEFFGWQSNKENGFSATFPGQMEKPDRIAIKKISCRNLASGLE